jgi:hypothetical protein
VVVRPRVAEVMTGATVGRHVQRAARIARVCRDAGVLGLAGAAAGVTPAAAPSLRAAAPPLPAAPSIPVASGMPDWLLAGPLLTSDTGGFGAGRSGGMPGGGGPPGAPMHRFRRVPEGEPRPGEPGPELTSLRVPEVPGPATVPEPPMIGLLAVALLAVVVLRRRHRGT